MLLIGRGFITIPSFCLARNEGGGGDCFCGERKCEKHPKNQAKFVVVWGGGGNLKLKTDFVMLCFVSVLFVLFGIQLATMNAFVGV